MSYMGVAKLTLEYHHRLLKVTNLACFWTILKQLRAVLATEKWVSGVNGGYQMGHTYYCSTHNNSLRSLSDKNNKTLHLTWAIQNRRDNNGFMLGKLSIKLC